MAITAVEHDYKLAKKALRSHEKVDDQGERNQPGVIRHGLYFGGFCMAVCYRPTPPCHVLPHYILPYPVHSYYPSSPALPPLVCSSLPRLRCPFLPLSALLKPIMHHSLSVLVPAPHQLAPFCPALTPLLTLTFQSYPPTLVTQC